MQLSWEVASGARLPGSVPDQILGGSALVGGKSKASNRGQTLCHTSDRDSLVSKEQLTAVVTAHGVVL